MCDAPRDHRIQRERARYQSINSTTASTLDDFHAQHQAAPATLAALSKAAIVKLGENISN
jgi:hypothetical protein